MAKKKLNSFERSFVAARRSGAKEFSFGGKKYTTALKGPGGSVKKTTTVASRVPTPSPKPARPTPSNAPTPSAAPRAVTSVPPKAAPAPSKDRTPTQPRRVITQPAAAKPDSNLAHKARDIADTRQRMELATTPKNRPTYEIGKVTASKLPQGEIKDYTTRRGIRGELSTPKSEVAVKGGRVRSAATSVPSGKTDRLPKKAAAKADRPTKMPSPERFGR